ncbi:MAG: hypothetical protein ACTHJL_09100 [Amnibacterium sp.]
MTGVALRPAGRIRTGSRAVAVLALLLLATVAGLLGGLAARSATAPRPAPSVAALSVLTTAGVDVFSRPQTAADRRDAPRGGDFVPASVRRLAVMPNVPSVLSAARDAAGDVCLVSAVKQGRQYDAACVPPAVFARHGITLQWSLSGWSAGEPFVDEGYLPRFFVSVWGPDGRIRYRTHVIGQPG